MINVGNGEQHPLKVPSSKSAEHFEIGLMHVGATFAGVGEILAAHLVPGRIDLGFGVLGIFV